MKRVLLGFSAVALAVASVPLFAAFEAHVINVTARIENALRVTTTAIDYGTVFPQEPLDGFVELSLSDSFRQEPRVDDVDYMIRQKPKCGRRVPNSSPIAYNDFQRASEDGQGNFVCPDGYDKLPLLCPFLSKHEMTVETPVDNDSVGINAFHGPVTGWTMQDTLATEVKGRLAKSQQDFDDRWQIDLRVPCFRGSCAQDWDRFVRSNNVSANPNDYMIDPALQHQVFGCDLWIEVTGVSETNG